MPLNMATLTHQRCFNHASREAAARCPECRRFFCRECITEHEDRVLCATCLKKSASAPLTKSPAFLGIKRLIQCAAGIFLAWFFFFLIGESLSRVPASFHDATIWQMPWIDKK
jgi:hypothetical protein